MKKIISTPELAGVMKLTRSRIHQLIDGRRIVPDYIADDGKARSYYFNVETAAFYAGLQEDQKDLPKGKRRNYDKPKKD